MKINIPKVISAVPMAEYAPKLEGKFLHVWVNPPMQKLREYERLRTTLQQEAIEDIQKRMGTNGNEQKAEGGEQSAVSGQQSEGAFARVLAQAATWLRVMKTTQQNLDGLDPKMLTWYSEIWSQGPQDTRWAVDELNDLQMQDPAFLSWMISATWRARAEHLERKKKV